MSHISSKVVLGARAAPLLDVDIGVDSHKRRTGSRYLVLAQETGEGTGSTSIFSSDILTGQRVSIYPDVLQTNKRSRVRIAVDSRLGAAVQGDNLVWFGVNKSFRSRVPVQGTPWTAPVDFLHQTGSTQKPLLAVGSGEQLYFLENPSSADQVNDAVIVTSQHPLGTGATVLAMSSVGDITLLATGKKLEVFRSGNTVTSVVIRSGAVTVDACETGNATGDLRVLVLFSDGSWQCFHLSTPGGTAIQLCQYQFQTSDYATEPRCVMLQDVGGLSSGALALTCFGFVVVGYSLSARQCLVETWTLDFATHSTCTATKELQVEALDVTETQPILKQLLKTASSVTMYQHAQNDIGAYVVPCPVPVATEAEVQLSISVLESEVKDLATRRSEAEQMVQTLEAETADLIAQLAEGNVKPTSLLAVVTSVTDRVIALETVASAMGEKQRQVADDAPALEEGGTVSDQMKAAIGALYIKLHALKLLTGCGSYDAKWYDTLKQCGRVHKENGNRFAKLFKGHFGHVLDTATDETACFPSSSGSTCVQLILDQLGYHHGSPPSLSSLLDKLASLTDKAKILPIVAVLLLFLAPNASSTAQGAFLAACDLPVALAFWGKLLYVADIVVGTSGGGVTQKSAAIDKQSFPRALPQLPHGLSSSLFLQSFEHLLHGGVFDTAEQLGSQIIESVSEVTPRAAVRLCFLAHHKRQLATLQSVFLLVPSGNWQLKTVVLAMMVEYCVNTNQVDFIERVSLDDATTDVVVNLLKKRPMVEVAGNKSLTPQDAQYRGSRLLIQFLSKKRRHRHALAECEALQATCEPSQAQQTLAVASTLRSVVKVCPPEVNVQSLVGAPESAIAEACASTVQAEREQQRGAGSSGAPSQQTKLSMAVMLQQQQQAAAQQQAANMNHSLGGGVSRWPPHQTQTPQRGMTQSSSFGGPTASGSGAAFGM